MYVCTMYVLRRKKPQSNVHKKMYVEFFLKFLRDFCTQFIALALKKASSTSPLPIKLMYRKSFEELLIFKL